MKFDVTFQYLASTGVFIKIETAPDGIMIHTVDGDVENHFTITAEDANELSEMLRQASEAVLKMNRGG